MTSRPHPDSAEITDRYAAVPGGPSSDERPTQIHAAPEPVPRAGSVGLLLQDRPRDPLAAHRVLDRLESRLIGRTEPTLAARYVLLEEIGSGGLGRVYAAYDPELDRKIAVKFLHASRHAERDGLRLLREAQAMAKLSHPNVVPVYDVGTLGDDVFIAMELVDGPPLSVWWSDKRRSWHEIRDVMLDAGRGLLAAHQAGLVHRDFKPANVLVGPDGRARVLDFGLARRAVIAPSSNPEPPSGSRLDMQLTAAGAIVGTPAYMAPEQHDLSAEEGPAADQFSFCVTLFEGLYGRRPFHGEDLADISTAIRRGVIAMPPPGSVVPPWLHRACLRGLSARPEDRFASMTELLDAMQHDRRRRRRGWLVLATAGILGGAAVIVTEQLTTPVHAADDDQLQGLVNDARAAAARSYFVYPPAEEPDAPTAYSVVVELEGVGGAQQQEARERAKELRAEFSQTLVRLGDHFWEREGGVPFAIDYYASALVFDANHERARERARMTRGELMSLVEKAGAGGFSRQELAAGESLAVLAEPDPERQRDRLEALVEGDHPPAASTAARLERVLPEKARTVLRRTPRGADKQHRKRGAKSEPRDADAPAEDPLASTRQGVSEDRSSPEGAEGADRLVSQAMAAMRRGERSTAEKLFHRALAIRRRHAGALAGLGQLHFDEGRYQEALRYAGRAVAAAPSNAGYRVLYGDGFMKVLAYDKARKQYEKAQALGSSDASNRLELLSARLGE